MHTCIYASHAFQEMISTHQILVNKESRPQNWIPLLITEQVNISMGMSMQTHVAMYVCMYIVAATLHEYVC